MKLPKFKNGTVFSGQEWFWAIVNGEVVKGIVKKPATCPYMAYFGWIELEPKHSWRRKADTEPMYLWVGECYSTKDAAKVVAGKIQCGCGREGRVRKVGTYNGLVAAGVYCSSCWRDIS